MRTDPDLPRRRHRFESYLLGLGVTILAVIVIVAVVGAVNISDTVTTTDSQQKALAPFYVAPSGWQAKAPGTLLRSEAVSGVPSGGLGWRVLYVTQKADGSPAVSSGLIFAPGPQSPAAPLTGRYVVAWAHPTVGMGDACAPSRTPDVESDVQGLANFLSAGWVVTATDYAGLGTAGTEEYLVGLSEAHDILNSVRAAQQIPETGAGTTMAVWGHSQGGQAALWAADQRSYAPELNVIAVAAAAPAAQLPILIDHQWSTLGGSLIASEVLLSFPAVYPSVAASEVSTTSSERVRELSNKCLHAALIDLAVSNLFGAKPLLTTNPMTVRAWKAAFDANTPPAPSIPTLIAQGTADPLVLPGSNAAYLQEACAASSPIQGMFIGDLGRMKAGAASAPAVFTWLQQRFAGVPMTSTCGTIPPVAPLAP